MLILSNWGEIHAEKAQINYSHCIGTLRDIGVVM